MSPEVLAGHRWQPTTPPYGWCQCGESMSEDQHADHLTKEPTP